MIDTAYGGKYLVVSSGRGYLPNVPANMCPAQGTLSSDSSGNMKIYDGHAWQSFAGGVMSIDLGADAISILKWAEQKMAEEQELAHLVKTNPTIKSIVDEMNKYKDQIEMVKILIKDEVKV